MNVDWNYDKVQSWLLRTIQNGHIRGVPEYN